MAQSRHLSLARLTEIMRRQNPPRWGSDYDPAIRATREEAPARSRPAQIWNTKLNRYCHALSSVEQKALLFAMFNPALFELQEQRMLATGPAPHPLAGHPLASGMALPPFRGTINVCERLDAINHHHWIYIDNPDGTDQLPVPFPFIGDFLLFLQDGEGPYCINWTIKDRIDGFSERFSSEKPSRSPVKDRAAAEMRHAIEELLHLDVGIPTIRIVDKDLPTLLIQNIRSLFLIMQRSTALDHDIYRELCERLQASVRTQQLPLDILTSMVHRYDLPFELLRSGFGRALWQRDVRAELMEEAIFLDVPLKPERRDPLQERADWFRRPLK